MTEKDTIRDLERQAANTKRLMDKLNRAAYGMTFDEALRLGNDRKEEEDGRSCDHERSGSN